MLEFFRSLFDGDATDDAVQSLRAIQDDLGYLNDLSVQDEWARRYVEKTADAAPDAMTALLGFIYRERARTRTRFLEDFALFIDPEQQAAFERFLGSRPAISRS